jgi:hypothetical protein
MIKTNLTTLLGGIGIAALLLLPAYAGNPAPVANKAMPAARPRQADPEALASKNAPRIKEAFTNLNSRIQLAYAGNTQAHIARVFGVLIGPNSTFTLPYSYGGQMHTWVIASSKSTNSLTYTATVDGATITGPVNPTGINHTFNPRGIAGSPTMNIENTNSEAVFIVFANILELKRTGWPVVQEDRLTKLGANIVDRTEAAAKLLTDIEFPYNTTSIQGWYVPTGSATVLQATDFDASPEWYVTGCGDGRSNRLSLEARKVGVSPPFATGDDSDDKPHLAIEAKQNLRSGNLALKNTGVPAFCAIIRLK